MTGSKEKLFHFSIRTGGFWHTVFERRETSGAPVGFCQESSFIARLIFSRARFSHPAQTLLSLVFCFRGGVVAYYERRPRFLRL